MGIFDFFKKLVKEKKAEEIVKEELAFSGIENWIKKKREENEIKEKEILVIIKAQIRKFTREIREKIVVLEAVDVESKKEKDELKGVVNTGRKDYIKSFENFLENLNNLEINDFEESTKKINKIFLDFNKSSYKNYARATILIGKEMADIKDGLKVFSKELIKTFDESKGIIDSFKRISLVKLKLDMITSIDETLRKISEMIFSLNKKIKDREKENKKLLEEREKRAVIIKAGGEVLAAGNMAKAAKTLATAPGALHLRTLQTLNDLSSDKSNTVVFAIPLEVLRAMEKLGGKRKK